MCGRYSQSAPLEKLSARFGFGPPAFPLKPRYNIAPTQEAPVIVSEDGAPRSLELFRWGLIPSWAKDPAVGNRMINARAETLSEKPSFRRPFQRTRCLVLADGFYEWKALPGRAGKTPYRIAEVSEEPFAMAGLWERWKAPDGRETRSFAIVTTRANSSLAPIHDRMPVVLDRAGEGAWLDPKAGPSDLKALLDPCPEGRLRVYPVSTAVNSPKNDSPECLRAL